MQLQKKSIDQDDIAHLIPEFWPESEIVVHGRQLVCLIPNGGNDHFLVLGHPNRRRKDRTRKSFGSIGALLP